MTTDPRLPNKKDVARALLLQGTVFVHLDPRKHDVVVPDWLRNQPQLVLQVGLDMPIPIPDLRVDHVGVFGTLSFSRQAVTCMVPWDAVFAVVGDDGRGMVWPASMPPEIAVEVEREARRGGKASPPALSLPEVSDEAPAPRPALSLVDGHKARPARLRESASGGARPSARPPYLRLVK